MFEDFLVMEWDWLEESLTDKEIDTFYEMLNKASEDKPDCSYYVCREDSPYAERIYDVVSRRKRPGISKEELIYGLKQLKECDPEIKYVEAEELLLKYINDKDIEKVFEDIKNNCFRKDFEHGT